jgi:hypothetical protein
MRTEFLLLAIYNKPRLNIDETCQALGMSTATGYTHRSRGKFPVAMTGSPLTADIRDVATALDLLRPDGTGGLVLEQAGGLRTVVDKLRAEVDELRQQVAAMQKGTK